VIDLYVVYAEDVPAEMMGVAVVAVVVGNAGDNPDTCFGVVLVPVLSDVVVVAESWLTKRH